LRKYPDRAKSSADLRKVAAALDDAIVCQVLVHLIQYMTEKEKLAICEYIPGSTAENLSRPVSDMSKGTADLLSQVTGRPVYQI